MGLSAKRVPVLVIVFAAVAGALPVILYWIHVGRAPTLGADEARRLLSLPQPPILVDVREPGAYRTSHLEGAANWPYAELAGTTAAGGLPDAFRNRKLLLICNSGLLSASAALRLRDSLGAEAWSVRGGLDAWYAASEQPCPAAFCRLREAAGELMGFPFQAISVFDQGSASIAAFGVKPVYMLLSCILIVVLWRRREVDLRVLRWALVLFLAGESFCALNYLFFGEDSYLIEYLHIYGMVLAFGFTTYALLEGADSRLLHVSEKQKRCTALDLCGACVKHGEAPCAARRLLLLASTALLLLACLPLLVRVHPDSYNTRILGVLYHYSHPVLFQLFEIRYAPVVAILCFGAALLVLRFSRPDPIPLAKIGLSAGVGFLGFSVFRMVLFHAFRGNLVWYIVWEEVTELIFVAGLGIALLIFRRGLFRDARAMRRQAQVA
ncbi:MAG: rhodanese-like domain-containing protein [bacterium]